MTTAGFPHSEICGYNGYLLLTAAYRSLSRPSSAPDAKAFTLRSLELDHVLEFIPFELSEFHLFPFKVVFVTFNF